MSVNINKNDSDSSNSESEIRPCSSKFDPIKALYEDKVTIPVKNAPMYENIQQFESALKHDAILPIGEGDKVRKREEEKKKKKEEEEKALEEKNKQRFAKYEALMPTRRERKRNNVLTRMEAAVGPLSVLRDCVDKRLRVKVITRGATGVRGELFATLVAFDKQWNLAMTDVLEVWRRKGRRKRKVPPGMGIPVEKGTAASISPVPAVTEKPLGNGVWECTRHLPQVMVRGEHVVLVSIDR